MKEDDVVLPAFSFISHEAKQFEKLREAFGLSEEEYLKSFKASTTRKTRASLRVIERANAGGDQARGFAEDTRFLLKTTKTSEKKVLLKHLKKYTEHVEKYGRQTFYANLRMLFD